MLTPYKHEPFTDFSVEENRSAFEAALKNVEGELGKDYPLVINGERVTTDDKIVSVNPAMKEQVIGVVSKASREIVDDAFKSAETAFHTWKNVNPEERANILIRAAAIIRRRKHEFSAWLVKEAGKPWKEADADTAEAIDFLEYYARQMITLKDGKPVNSREGEHNRYFYTPIGVCVTISPWNFALAIMAGTTVAPIVTGNTVLLKPASTTPVVAAKFVEVLEEAGLPKGVVNFVPGSGTDIGDYLIDHPKTSLITFTGSRDVGVRLYERAAVVHPGQQHLKRVIVEMGGKDTVVVDKDADLDLAAQSIVTSAFGFSGQKCSAGSRAVIHQDVYDVVLEKAVALTKQLSVGEPTAPDVYMGPVVDQGAFSKIMSYIEVGKEEGRLMVGGEGDDSKGFFIQPTIFADVDPHARIMQEEIFGPVVAFSKARDFDHALEIANNTEYGLTGAVITTNRHHIEKAKRDFHVGNLYFNRNCTGAIVGYHPFGGFKMSGTDSKAGGPDYLALHMQAKTVSEMY
ncbi:L-glutamate gamma-semialdehyde dehydrogenase [Halalkalibacterium halodurans]|jgi:1-pyrroline-5-carboxylate dehydrogenase|uniref:1-pyrroline-5-carboxylate dehydrogenase 2 n=2 Tax=Halalkalibacterium halodurans TaxID=86665 RepID=ROCA2_HALH5|nr:L-glutamate gamma-semialdehyde dehydrogenase [Halalkalibacterium halodurans]Q9K5Z5.1 RecName: Full=1-pyrroline-5-carboxylate dehydrogenase 2; Short=P5C dehydrogenase 2; AltName: Full=L-glutamate gamma-semialdehyde dehydrogenase [Halalkalibacterium halodurans C-125]MDY7224459.1 L-glutamate gamma-semialdehyde dehydrogenase [Halalkalibacterium halodurans]MDY7243744.1 L-glutamate gamma-semialdehyde dehydrogenase [Halalkalibacterium halodurans]MED3645791.1 L-glutamate gamma-semialdehyde dehydroge